MWSKLNKDLSPTIKNWKLPKYKLSKDNNRYSNLEKGKLMKPQPSLKNYR